MKNKWWVLVFFLFGCHSHKQEREKPLPDLPHHFMIPLSPPEYNIQINSVPFPFNITHTHVIWVNNRRLNISRKQLDVIVQHLNLSTDRPKDTAQIHNGEGWMRPFKIE